ncbi:MAG: response regulator [Calditrichaceae bacterium]|nr:response regulator [Calditrichaceae bacterium]HES59760.1 response regulator [Caldithrix sp.]
MKKILVVEDNTANMYLMRFILQKAGYQVIEAWDGVEGVQKAREEKPDLILMDMQLPLQDGYTSTKEIRAFKEGGDVPIIAITSYAMVGDREKTLNAGCTAYLEKPINPETFLDEINKYL